MDELQQAWQDLKGETENFTGIQKEEFQKAISEKSHGQVSKLRSQVRWKFYFCIFFSVILAVGIPFVNILASQILLTLLLAAYIVGGILLYQELIYLKKNIDMSENLLEGLKTYHHRIKQVLKYEELTGLILYPFSLSAGFFIGLQAGDPSEPIMNERSDWIALVIAMIVITPLAHLLARWMNKVAFGKYLKQLQKNIDELENFEA